MSRTRLRREALVSLIPAAGMTPDQCARDFHEWMIQAYQRQIDHLSAMSAANASVLAYLDELEVAKRGGHGDRETLAAAMRRLTKGSK